MATTPSRPPVRPRGRSTSRSREYISSSGGAPGTSIHDLPSSSTIMASLDLVRSKSNSSGTSTEYRGGLALGTRVSTRREKRVVGREGLIEEGDEREKEVVDEEVALGEGGQVIEETKDRAELMYERFSRKKKSCIVAIVAYAALLAPFSSASFLPSIPEIVKDLNTTATILNVTVAVFIIVIGIFPLLFAPYAGVYGRRPIYLVSLPIFTLGSMGVALSPSLVSLVLTRILQGIGSSAVLSVGAGTIGDLYPRSERGTAMGYFYSGILVGPALAPAIAGVLTEYVRPHGYGWRAMQWLLFSMGVVASVLVIVALPETIHVKGRDAIKKEREEEVDRRPTWWERNRWTKDWVVVWLNPAAPLKLLVHPHILAMSLNSSFVLMSTYTILVPLGETLAPRYNITNSAILGCFYLSQGLGNAFASQWTGRYADYVLARWLKKRNGVYVAEDRLKATLIGGGAILPLSVLAIGWVMEKASGKGGLAGAVILLFVDGVGLMCVLTPANTYCVDCMQHRSAEVIAVNNAIRYLFSAAASAFVLPMIQAIGVGWTNTFAACLCWVGFGLVLICIRFGGRMRAWGLRNDKHERERLEEEERENATERSERTLVREEGENEKDEKEGVKEATA